MNILFISTKSAYLGKTFGGAESSMKLLAERLAAKDHTIRYVTNDAKYGLFPAVRKTSSGNVEIHSLRLFRGDGRVRWISNVNNWIFNTYVLGLLRKTNTKICYCYYQLRILESLLFIKKRLPPLKIMMRMAGMHWHVSCLRNPELRNVFTNVFNQVDSVNYIHEGLKEMTERKFKEMKMDVHLKHYFIGDIGSGVTFKRENDYANLNNDHFTIIMATRFTKSQKRHDILVKAVSLLKPDMKLKVLMIGEGPEKDKIQQMIHAFNLHETIKIIPFKTQDELWQEMMRADLLCHACDYEGLGKIIIESMALGLPVLVSNVPPLNQYIIDGVNGYLADNDPYVWARKIENIRQEKMKRMRISQNAMDYIDDHYSPDVNVLKYERVFEEMLRQDTLKASHK